MSRSFLPRPLLRERMRPRQVSVLRSREIEKKHLSRRVRDDADFRLVADCGAVALRERCFIDRNSAARNLNPSVASRLQRDIESLPVLELRHRQRSILMNRHRFFAPFAAGDRDQRTARLADVDLTLLISGSYPARRRHDPDLQKMHRLRLRMVELAMRDSRARAHPLHFADSDDRAGPETVLMLERTVENVGDNFHVAMPMSRESRAGANSILVDYTQRAKPALRGVVIFTE